MCVYKLLFSLSPKTQGTRPPTGWRIRRNYLHLFCFQRLRRKVGGLEGTDRKSFYNRVFLSFKSEFKIKFFFSILFYLARD